MIPVYVIWSCIIACILLLVLKFAKYRRAEQFAEPADFYLRGDGAWANNQMVGASASTPGQAGFVPAPPAGNHGAYLGGDGNWALQSYGLFALAPAVAGGATAKISPVSTIAVAPPVQARSAFIWNTTPVYASGISCTGANIIFANPGVYIITAKLRIPTVMTAYIAPGSSFEIAYSPNGGTSWLIATQVQPTLLAAGTDILITTMADAIVQSAIWRVQYQYTPTSSMPAAALGSLTLSLPLTIFTNSLTIYRVA